MKKSMITALLLGLALSATGCAGQSAKETETTTEAAQTESATEAETGTEAGTEAAVTAPERPDYKALDYVTLGEYKGLEVTLSSLDVTDDEINSEIQSTLSQNEKLEEVKKGTVEMGDVADIDYEGKLDGEAFEGGTDKGYELTIGSGTFIEGFEEGLVGKEIGETLDLPLTFPENYSSTDLAGKDVVFTVTINSVKRMPELTDELVAEVSDYKTVDEYKESIRTSLTDTKKTEQKNQEISDLIGLVYNASEIKEYPEELIKYQLDSVKAYYTSYAQQSEQTLDEFLQAQMGVSEADFDTQMTETIKQSLRSELILRAIAETEGLSVSDEEYNQGITNYATQYGMDEESFIAQYGEGEVKNSLIQDKAVNILLDNAVVHDPNEGETEAGTEAASEAESETAAESETKAE